MSKINFLHEPDHVYRGNSTEDIGIPTNNIVKAKSTDEEKPCDDDWSEHATDSLGPVMLQCEKAN